MGKAQRTRSAREKLEQVRARQRAEERRRRIICFGGGVAVAAVIAVIAVSADGGGSSQEVMPAGVGGGTPYVQPAARTVANTTGITGVVAYDTTGWPANSSNGPANQSLGHTHLPGPVQYSVPRPSAATTTRPG